MEPSVRHIRHPSTLLNSPLSATIEYEVLVNLRGGGKADWVYIPGVEIKAEAFSSCSAVVYELRMDHVSDY